MRFQYCPHCGKKAEMRQVGDEGVIPYCAVCEVPLWDLFTTSIIAAVVNEYDEVALLRQDYVSTTNHVCVAGVMKPGESAEETVVREISEELGLRVKSLKYIKSYPYEKKEMLMLGFQAVVDKQEFILSGEVDAAEWVRFEDALPLLREGSIAWQLVKAVTGGQDDLPDR
ncbi:MAG: NUDIX domain-containing protein [Lachnospiraceae bacterium]